MLEHTFIHIPGVGRKTELSLWNRGIRTWRDFLDRGDSCGLGQKRTERVTRHLLESDRRLRDGDHVYFGKRLPAREAWRAFPDFKDSAAYLDIETTGLSKSSDEVTVIGLYDGAGVKTYINGINLEEFLNDIEDYSLVVTYNGACFDLPFLRSHFKNLKIEAIHVDLRFALKRLGFGGGLKNIERTLGMERDEETAGLDGWDAVRLWNEYKAGREESLDLLVKYNREDIISLETLMEFSYERLRGMCFDI